MKNPSWSTWKPVRLFAVVAAGILATQLLLTSASPVLAVDLNPRDLAITDDEAGKQATRAADEEGSDGRSRWVHLRWQRDEEGPDFFTGPGTVDNTVWVANDLASAKAIFREQSDKNIEFPEAYYSADGPYELSLSGVWDEVSALSACRDCNAKDTIYLHHRAVIRRGVVVTVLYLYGTEETASQGLMGWYANLAAGRIPDSATQAPEVVGGGPAPAAGGPPAGGDGGEATANPAPDGPVLNQANPKDLAVKIDEAGKRAEVDEQDEGTDARGKWYQVRYERGGTGSRFFEGPVTVYSYVFVGKNIESGKQVFQEQAQRNEDFPEAKEKVGDRFELKEASEVGEEGMGMSACERSCNSGSEIYVHKRLVSRHQNIVSVIYLYGLSTEEGTTDWHARYFSDLVMKRARAE